MNYYFREQLSQTFQKINIILFISFTNQIFKRLKPTFFIVLLQINQQCSKIIKEHQKTKYRTVQKLVKKSFYIATSTFYQNYNLTTNLQITFFNIFNNYQAIIKAKKLTLFNENVIQFCCIHNKLFASNIYYIRRKFFLFAYKLYRYFTSDFSQTFQIKPRVHKLVRHIFMNYYSLLQSMMIAKSATNNLTLNWNSFSDNEDEEDNISSERVSEKTSECSIQVNMDLENFKETDETSKKRQKKKQYRRRKKEKIKQLEKEAKLQLVMIIEKIYTQQVNFHSDRFAIQVCLRRLKKDAKFHNFLDEVIKMHVKRIQKEIWEYTQAILHQNPFENEGNHRFYYQMVNKIYEEYQFIKVSSIDIQKIINLYMKIAAEEKDTQFQGAPYRNLDRNTFNYLIQSDQTLKSLMRIFRQNIPQNTCQARNKLNQMLQILHQFNFPESQEQNEHSTSIQQQEENLQKNSRRRKNKKKKIKDNDIKPEFQDIMEKIDSFNIDEQDRIPCRVHSEWVLKLQNELDYANYSNIK